jgi:hypothetical protein
MDHLQELLLLAEPLDVTQTLACCLNIVFTLQGMLYNTTAFGGIKAGLAAAISSPSAAELYTYSDAVGK